MIGDRSDRRGFTLMETVVVMTLFLIFTLSITEIYMLTTRYGRQVVLRAKTQEQVRGDLEAIARAIRVSDIDYGDYGGTLPAQPMSILRLINPKERDVSNTRPSWKIRLETDPAVCAIMNGATPCIILSLRSTDLSALNPPGTQAEDLRFYVSPPQDPFAFNPATGTYASSKQPSITIYMRIRGLAAKASDQWVMSLQTTVTPRLYLR